MVTRIEWTDTAVRKYRDIILYYKTKDARKAGERFIKAVSSKINKLEQQPYIGRESQKFKTMRIINIDAYRQMAYRVKGTTLFISNFWDMRQNPLAVACGKDASTGNPNCPDTSAETAGPFPTKAPDTLAKNSIISDRQGTPLTVKIIVKNGNNNCAVMKDAVVDVWHCDAAGYVLTHTINVSA